MDKYLKLLLILSVLYVIALFLTASFSDNNFYSQSYSVKFCSKHPINCINSLLSLSPKVKENYEPISDGILIPCVEFEGVSCPQ